MKIMALYYIVNSHNLMKIQNVFTDLFLFFFFFLPLNINQLPLYQTMKESMHLSMKLLLQ